MKKLTLSLLSFLLSFSMFAGGIVTNTNQSAAWTRMMVRDASTDVDAVFYNPAGLTKLSDGLHISINNQTIGQVKTVSTAYEYLNNAPVEYEGKISAPIFPGFYAAYKTGNWAFSFGFNGIGGGGSADFATGLPSMELPVATMVPMFASQGLNVTDYRMNMNFKGSSIYFGFQVGASYAINEHISVYAGGRYVMAKNTYEGELKDIEIYADGAWTTPGAYLTGVSAQATAGATQLYGTASLLDPFLAMPGGGDLTLAQAQAYGFLTAEQVAGLEGGLSNFGIDPTGFTIKDVNSAYNVLGDDYSSKAAQLLGMATVVDAQTADQKAEVTQTGNGFTPIVGLNISAMDNKLNIGMKYEFKTNLILTNETTLDFNTAWDASGNVTESMFPDGKEINADMPAMFSIGVKYQVLDALSVQAGFHTYFDGQVDWDNVVDVKGNSFEYALGAEYNVTDNILVSAGWLMTRTSVRESYQTDLSYSLNTNTFGAGGMYKINDMFSVELGAFYTLYEDAVVSKYYDSFPTFYDETYKKTAWGVGVGVNINLFGGSTASAEE